MDENPYISPRASLRTIPAGAQPLAPLWRRVLAVVFFCVGAIYFLFGLFVAGYESSTYGITPLFLYECLNFPIGVGFLLVGLRLRRVKTQISGGTSVD
jgi:hypothetical protein